MNAMRVVCLALIGLSGAFLASGWAQAAKAVSTRQSNAAAFLSASFKSRNLPGAAAVVILGDAVEFVSFGSDAGGKAITPKTRLYAGSLSKAFTAAAVLQLVEQGRIEIDAPVQRYLPEFELADPRASAITIRHLLNQTSGMANIGFEEWRMPQPKALTEVAPRMAGVRLVSNPGERFSYHNPNYEILARLVEVVSGLPFAAYMRDHVFGPLGMADTVTVDRQDERGDGAALGHVYAFGRFFPMHAPKFFINGAGGVLTTPEDYSRWLIAQMKEGVGPNGVRILSEKSIRATHTPAATSGEYGFGWNRRGDRISHSGGLPTFGAYAAMQGDLAVAVFAPVVSVAAPSREFALGALDRLQGKDARPVGPDATWWIDYIVAAAAVLIWASCVRAVIRAGSWARVAAAEPIWRCVLAFAPHGIVVSGVLLGIPFLVSRVQSWSWFWLWAYVPVWTVALLSAATAAAVVACVRFVALANSGR